MTGALRRAVACASVLLLLSACTPDSEGGLLQDGVDVDVDTAELRELKRDAAIEDCEPASTEPVDGGLPDLTLPCLGGGPDVNLGSLRGPLVVNFWASWCGPCRRELPYYQAFSEQHADRVPVIGVDWNDLQPVQALELARDSGVTYPSLADPGDELAEAGLRLAGLPGIAFVDADGRLTKLVFEEIDSVNELEELVEEHLGVSL